MAKISPSVVRRPPRREKVYEFRDPQNPELAFSLRLRFLGGMEMAAATELAQEKVREYITGTGSPDQKGYEPPVPFPPVDGQGVDLSKTACQVIATVCFAQVAPEDDLYTFEELASFATVDVVSAQMVAAFEEITEGFEEDKAGDDQSPLAAAST